MAAPTAMIGRLVAPLRHLRLIDQRNPLRVLGLGQRLIEDAAPFRTSSACGRDQRTMDSPERLNAIDAPRPRRCVTSTCKRRTSIGPPRPPQRAAPR